MTQTIGIDLASQDAGTALARVHWNDDHAVATAPVTPCGQQPLLDALGEGVPVGIDAPFGWPASFRAAIEGWSTSQTWPHEGWMAPRKERDWHVTQLRLRGTDQFVWSKVGFSPLSVAAEKIAVTTMRCVAVLAANDAGRPTDLTGGDSIFEVYPAAALKSWNILEPGYKGTSADAAERRANMLAELAEIVPLVFEGEGTRDRLLETDHALDALVAALVARAADLGLTYAPPPRDGTIAFELRGRALSVSRSQLETEGWIHLPKASSLRKLVPQSGAVSQ